MAVIRKWIWLFFALALLAGLAVLRHAVRGTDILNLTIADMPLRPIAAQPGELTARFPERFPLQVAVLLTRGSNGGFGVVHALQEMGIPFFVRKCCKQLGEAFGKVVGCNRIGLGFSREDTSRMRSSPFASAGISVSLSAIVIWKSSWRKET